MVPSYVDNGIKPVTLSEIFDFSWLLEGCAKPPRPIPNQKNQRKARKKNRRRKK